MDELRGEGIGKNRRNQAQGFSFRGIDDVHNALSAPLAKARLCMLPRVTDRVVTERPTKSGGSVFYTVLTVEFDLVAAEDGSKHTITVIGEAMDSADKSSNKAMSAAYKYAAIQAFCIPVEAQPDADEETPEPVHQQPPKAQPLSKATQAQGVKVAMETAKFPPKWGGEWGGKLVASADAETLATYLSDCDKWVAKATPEQMALIKVGRMAAEAKLAVLFEQESK
jgi:hypothetical protein